MADPKLRRLRRKAHKARRDERTHKLKARRYKRRLAYIQALITKTVHRRHNLDHEVVLDGCPMPLAHKLMLLDARQHGWEGEVTSADRRDAIARLLHRLGKSTQRELYEGWIKHLPGFLPANPPDRGTHMRIGDGVVGTLFEKLPYWMEGIDSSLATQLRTVLNKLGYRAYRPYASESEEHHTNLAVDPKQTLIARGRV